MEYRKFLLSLLALAVSLPLVSCSDSQAVRLRYEAERLYYQASRQMKIAADAPERSRTVALKSAADAYGVSLEFALASLDSISAATHPVEEREVRFLAFHSANRLFALHFQARNFDTCVSILSRLLEKASYEGTAQVTINVGLGRALQASGQWDRALAVYHSALEGYFPPVDDSGKVIEALFQLPLHIFQIAQVIGDSSAAREHYDIALEYYNSLITENPEDSATALSYTALARLYHESGQWGMVISQLRVMADNALDESLNVQIKIADIYNRMPHGHDSAMAIYQDLLNNLTPADSGYRPRLKFKIALMTMEVSEFKQARDMLIDLKKNHPRYYSSAPLVQFTIARAFELLGLWGRAETEYKFLIEGFRGSQQAMATYLLLADHYRDQGRHDEAQKWYRDAEAHYNEIAVRNTGTLIEARALTFKANLYHRQDDPRRSAELLVSLFEKFPKFDYGRNSLLRAAVIYRNQLNQPEIADSLVDRLRSMLLHPVEGWGT